MGAKDLSNVARLLEMANRKCLIISDCDKPSKEAQTRHRTNKIHGSWYTFEDIYNHSRFVTMEDFITPDGHASKVASFVDRFPSAADLTTENFRQNKPRIDVWKEWAGSLGLDTNEQKSLLNEIKDLLVKDLKAAEIEADYELLHNFITDHGFAE